MFNSKRRDIEEWKSLTWGQGEGVGEFPIFCRTPSPSYPTRAPSSRLFFGAKILTNFFWQAHACFLFAQVHHTHSFFNFISPGIQISRPLTPLGCGACTHHEKELTKLGVWQKRERIKEGMNFPQKASQKLWAKKCKYIFELGYDRMGGGTTKNRKSTNPPGGSTILNWKCSSNCDLNGTERFPESKRRDIEDWKSLTWG